MTVFQSCGTIQSENVKVSKKITIVLDAIPEPISFFDLARPELNPVFISKYSTKKNISQRGKIRAILRNQYERPSVPPFLYIDPSSQPDNKKKTSTPYLPRESIWKIARLIGREFASSTCVDA
jgi:hypothetical protein